MAAISSDVRQKIRDEVELPEYILDMDSTEQKTAILNKLVELSKDKLKHLLDLCPVKYKKSGTKTDLAYLLRRFVLEAHHLRVPSHSDSEEEEEEEEEEAPKAAKSDSRTRSKQAHQAEEEAEARKKKPSSSAPKKPAQSESRSKHTFSSEDDEDEKAAEQPASDKAALKALKEKAMAALRPAAAAARSAAASSSSSSGARWWLNPTKQNAICDALTCPVKKTADKTGHLIYKAPVKYSAKSRHAPELKTLLDHGSVEELKRYNFTHSTLPNYVLAHVVATCGAEVTYQQLNELLNQVMDANELGKADLKDIVFQSIVDSRG